MFKCGRMPHLNERNDNVIIGIHDNEQDTLRRKTFMHKQNVMKDLALYQISISLSLPKDTYIVESTVRKHGRNTANVITFMRTRRKSWVRLILWH